ncbi:alpha-galactosidase [Candidatus Poribacteria bacterium]|nr:alpha-galactosidase [Candidatus Poribacteria bacterium]
MRKIAFLGAGSFGFGRRLVSDILSFPELADSTLFLMDPAADRLDHIRALSERMASEAGLPAKIEASIDRRQALDGADYVIASIRVGSNLEPEALDVRIPLEVAGLRQTVSDTVGVGGIMKGLRTIPAMLDIARDMESLCPSALLLNYTNPMAMIMWAIADATRIDAVGLCHSVQGTSEQLARYAGVDYATLRYHVAGINHMAWFLELSQGDQDLYPRLRACLDDSEAFSRDPVRFEILRHFGYFVTESSTHMSEYVPYFLRSPEEIERLSLRPRTAESFAGQQSSREERWRTMVAESAAQPAQIRRSNEYGARIIHAMETGSPLAINGNVPNTGLIRNLSQGSCVEVPCLVDRSGLHPCFVGDLPPQCAALCESNIRVQGLVVRAILESNREHVFHAAMADPNTTAQLTLPQIREVMAQLLAAQRDLIPRSLAG